MRLAVYPGSFDPMTNGHVDVIRRASVVFDRLVVAVLANPRKTPLLPVDTRIGIIRAALEAERIDAERFEVASFDGLTVDFCRARGATAIVRGLRAISDFDSEMQLAHNNRVLAPDVDSVFFMTSVENGFVSSSLVKEIASFGGDVSSMVPARGSGCLEGGLRARLTQGFGQNRLALNDRQELATSTGPCSGQFASAAHGFGQRSARVDQCPNQLTIWWPFISPADGWPCELGQIGTFGARRPRLASPGLISGTQPCCPVDHEFGSMRQDAHPNGPACLPGHGHFRRDPVNCAALEIVACAATAASRPTRVGRRPTIAA